jgi:hypothetical protein
MSGERYGESRNIPRFEKMALFFPAVTLLYISFQSFGAGNPHEYWVFSLIPVQKVRYFRTKSRDFGAYIRTKIATPRY